MKKILVIHNIVHPTRTFLFNEMRKHFKSLGFSFKVIFLSQSDKNRDWEFENDFKFDHEVLKNHNLRFGKKDLHTFFINTDIWKKLSEENPDIILCFGWDHSSAYLARLWAYKNNKKFIFFAESTISEKSWRRTLFNPLVKFFVRRIDSFWAGGTRAKEYLMTLGVSSQKIQIFYNSVDIDYFSKKCNELTLDEKNAIKKILGITTSKTILFVGQLIERKGIHELLEGFAQYQKNNCDISLLIIGNGIEKEGMAEVIKNENIQNVYFKKFAPYDEIYKYHAIADLFILPSREEVWGLVLNEAAACGLPIISTTVTGASIDLIENDRNGYTIEPKCPKCIASAIEKIFANKLDIKNTSAEIVQKTNIPKMLNTIKL